jgi:hypothetical protein
MNASTWAELGKIADRPSSLTQKGQAAAASGDLETARHFFRLAKEAEADRLRIVDQLCGTVTEFT